MLPFFSMSTMVRVRAPHGFRPWWVVGSWLDVHQQQRASVNQFVRFFLLTWWSWWCFFFNLLVFQKLLQCDVLFQVSKCLVSKNTKRRPNEGTLHWSPEADNSPGDISACQRGVGPDGLKAGNFRWMASWEWTCLDVLAKLVFLLLLLLLLLTDYRLLLRRPFADATLWLHVDSTEAFGSSEFVWLLAKSRWHTYKMR